MRHVKYLRRESSVYYRRRKRALASHSRRGLYKPSGLSGHLRPGTEVMMSAEERKRFRLPCGRTIAESWAALRKCWLGFYITKSQDDVEGMKEFAYRIRRIQAELDIKPTDFDTDILDQDTVIRIDSLYRKSSKSSNDEDNTVGTNAESNEMDYSYMMDVDEIESSLESMPAPRQDIFTRTEKSCPSPAYQPNAYVDLEVTDYEKSCYRGPPKQRRQNEVDVQRRKTTYKKQCQLPRVNPNNFAVSAPENTLAVPNPNQPPIIPIIRGNSCAHQPAEDQLHTVHEDKSCLSDSQLNQMQGTKKEKASQRKAKSCLYTSQD